jgi:hypothetical protein
VVGYSGYYLKGARREPETIQDAKDFIFTTASSLELKRRE